jgi:large subunit ribosomal protein L10
MAILTDYRGLTVAQMADLRRELRSSDVEVRVAKNTLLRLAAKQAGREGMVPLLEGPTAVAFVYGDPAVAAKSLTDTVRTRRLGLTVKSAVLGDKLLQGADVSRIAELPSRDVLIAQVVGSIQAPISSFVGVLAATLQSFLGTLEARRQQLEEGGAAA